MTKEDFTAWCQMNRIRPEKYGVIIGKTGQGRLCAYQIPKRKSWALDIQNRDGSYNRIITGRETKVFDYLWRHLWSGRSAGPGNERLATIRDVYEWAAAKGVLDCPVQKVETGYLWSMEIRKQGTILII